MLFNLLFSDAVIASVTEYLKDKAFFMYTFSKNSIESDHFSRKPLKLYRKRRQANEEKENTFTDEHVRLSTGNIEYYADQNKETITITDMSVKTFANNKTVLGVTLTTNSDKVISFNIVYEDGYFFMYDLKYDDITFVTDEIYAPVGFSYYCGNTTFSPKVKDLKEPKASAGVSYRLKWDSLQFQAFVPNGSRKDKFLDAWYCDGFFTPGILMSLLMIIFLMGVTFTGIAWLMDIKTMDRFDDPKGKSITINTSE